MKVVSPVRLFVPFRQLYLDRQAPPLTIFVFHFNKFADWHTEIFVALFFRMKFDQPFSQDECSRTQIIQFPGYDDAHAAVMMFDRQGDDLASRERLPPRGGAIN